MFGYTRIPIVSWLHAQEAGELITQFGGHPSLRIGPLLETHRHDVGEVQKMLRPPGTSPAS
jgi:bacterioferritin